MAKDVIIACDFDSKEKVFSFLDNFKGKKPFVKIGMELYYAEGPEIVKEIKKRGHKIFLDLKLHDIPNTVKKSMAVLSRLDVDMCNLHAGGTINMMKTAIEGLTRQEAVRDFLEDSIYCITHNTDYDAFAHIDYLTRYWIYKGEYLEYADAPELFDELFKILADGNKAIEINTRRLDDQKAIDALVPLYKRFAELGGKYCTLGSDAHYAEHVGRRMDVALAIAHECGLTPVYFEKRQMKIIEV